MARDGNRRVIVFDDFTKGEYGLLRPVEYGDRGKTGSWTGSNICVLPDGSLCSQSQPEAQSTTLPALAGAVVDMGMGRISTGEVIWFKAGNRTYQSGAGPTYTFTQNTGTSANTASYIDRVASNTSTYAITSTNVLEVIDHAAGSVAAVVGSPPSCATVAQYGDRLMLGGTGSNSNRLYYSAAGNFASWPSGNYMDVGDSAPIVALVPMRGFLLVAKSGGTDDTWWAVRGIPGVNHVLRRASRFHGPTRSNNVALLNDNRIVFSAPHQASGISSPNVPATFNGSTGDVEPWLASFVLPGTSSVEAYRLANRNDAMLKNQTGVALRRNGAWSRISWPSALQVNTTNFGTKSRSVAADLAGGTFHMMNDAGDTFYQWKPYMTRPALDSDTDGTSPTTAGSFALPEWRAAFGDEVAVVAVMVAFRKWNLGSGNNTLSVVNTVTGTYNTGATSNTDVGTFTEASSSSSQEGTRARHWFGVPPVWGTGFQLSVSSMRGVAIESITVVCSTQPMAGVA